MVIQIAYTPRFVFATVTNQGKTRCMTISEVYLDISPDTAGMRWLFRQFSFPGGIPSHVTPVTPGSIHEGGELGYALLHTYHAAEILPIRRMLPGPRKLNCY